MTEVEVSVTRMNDEDDERPVWRSVKSAQRMLDQPSRGYIEMLCETGVLEWRRIGRRVFISDASIRCLQAPPQRPA